MCACVCVCVLRFLSLSSIYFFKCAHSSCLRCALHEIDCFPQICSWCIGLRPLATVDRRNCKTAQDGNPLFPLPLISKKDALDASSRRATQNLAPVQNSHSLAVNCFALRRCFVLLALCRRMWLHLCWPWLDIFHHRSCLEARRSFCGCPSGAPHNQTLASNQNPPRLGEGALPVFSQQLFKVPFKLCHAFTAGLLPCPLVFCCFCMGVGSAQGCFVLLICLCSL